ncbi:HAD family hydrolase [Candidatus Parcubacteria bacterium]|nr:HAD family hydrolase [Candidatus Parcubacteria bacterium]
MKKLIIFDWNGTLLSDTRACMDADNHVLKIFGGTPVDLKTYRDTMIIPAIDFYTQHGCDKEELQRKSQKLGEVFHSFYELRAAKCRLRQGAKLLLKWLSHHSIKSVILSNHTIKGINNQLNRLKINKYIFEVLANSALDSSMKRRNKKEKLKDYLEKHNYKPSETLIIGDSPEEIEIGKKFGLTTIAITRGYHSTSRLRAAEPDYLIHNLSELIEVLKKF